MSEEKRPGNGTSSRNPIGCGAVAFIGAMLIGLSIYLFNRWDSLGGFARSGAVAASAMGTLLTLPFIVILALKLFIRRAVQSVEKEFSEFKATGEQILARTKAIFGQIHEYRPALDSDFDSVNRDFYERASDRLAERGYRHVGDIVNKTLESMGQPAIPIRCFVSSDGQTVVGAYHLAVAKLPEHLQGKEIYTYDVSSEFSDGTFLMTSNTADLDVMTPPPQLHKQQRPRDTTLEELLELHGIERSRLCAAKNNAKCTVVQTLDDVLAGERRQQVIKNNVRTGIGYVDPNEIRRIASRTAVDQVVVEGTVRAVEEAKDRHND